MVFYQRRGTGKTTNLVKESSATWIPIAAVDRNHLEHIQYIADKVLCTEIPKPFIASPEACRAAGEYLVDEGERVLQKLLGGKIVLMTITDDGGEELDEYFDTYVRSGKDRKAAKEGEA